MAIYPREDARTALPQLEKNFNEQTQNLQKQIDGLLDFFYPIGCYFETSDTAFNPNESWGGSWELETEGQVHISAGANYSVSGAGTNTTDGGASTVTLTIDTMPSHNHTQASHAHQVDHYRASGATAAWTLDNVNKTHGVEYWTTSATPTIYNNGGGKAHENMPPYIVVNRWHRVN